MGHGLLVTFLAGYQDAEALLTQRMRYFREELNIWQG